MKLVRGMTSGWAFALGMIVLVAPIQEAHSEEIYTRTAQGVVDVATDGTVAELSLEGDLGEARAGYEAMMQRWQFEPILTTDGDPVDHPVRVSMRVDLFAARQEDGSLSMSTGRPTFRPLDDPDYSRRVTGIESFPSPRYPEQGIAGGYGAKVVLLVRVAADGTVTQVGTLSAALLDLPSERGAERRVRPFIHAARRAVERIRFTPTDGGERQLTLPIQFTMHRGSGERDTEAWSRVIFVPGVRDPWVQAALSGPTDGIQALDPSGEPVDTRVALSIEIEDPWL